jgi:hypothetical protein
VVLFEQIEEIEENNFPQHEDMAFKSPEKYPRQQQKTKEKKAHAIR